MTNARPQLPTENVTEAVVYYQITLAVHVDLAAESVDRIVELREEIRARDGDPPMLVKHDGHVECDPDPAAHARRIAATSTWPATWEFGY